MSGWAAVLFDLDGTLADTVELILCSYRHTMKTHLGEEPPDERWLCGMGTPLDVQLAEFARDVDEAVRMRETYAAFQREVHDSMVRPYPGALDVTCELRRRGARLGLVTSKRSEMTRRTLDCCGLAERFDVVVCADHVVRAKPDPEPVARALEALELSDRAGEVLFVGDSPFDLRSGRAAGTRTAAATWGPFARDVLALEEPDYWVDRLDEVLGIAPGAPAA